MKYQEVFYMHLNRVIFVLSQALNLTCCEQVILAMVQFEGIHQKNKD